MKEKITEVFEPCTLCGGRGQEYGSATGSSSLTTAVQCRGCNGSGEKRIQRSVITTRKVSDVSRASASDYETAFYQLIASMTLADHLGDVAEDIERALNNVGDQEAADVLKRSERLDSNPGLLDLLASRNITTVHGTRLK